MFYNWNISSCMSCVQKKKKEEENKQGLEQTLKLHKILSLQK